MINWGMKGLSFGEVDNVDSSEFRDAIKIYNESFPPAARKSAAVLRKRISSGREKLMIGVLDKHVVVSFALLWPLEGSGFVLLDYFAVRREYRSRAIGSAFLKYLSSFLRPRGERLIIEVDDPHYGGGREKKRRRVSFYKRCGARELVGVEYYLRSLSSMPKKLILMVLPARRGSGLEGVFVRNLVAQIYRELYHLSRRNKMVRSTLSTIFDAVRLE